MNPVRDTHHESKHKHGYLAYISIKGLVLYTRKRMRFLSLTG